MVQPFLSFWVCAALFVAAGDKPATAGPDRGAQLAATCVSCHRLDGRDSGIPSIAGLEAEKLTRLLQGFKSDEGSMHIMHAVSLSLSGDEIAEVARYLAAQGKETR